jgi:hypothetical protein
MNKKVELFNFLNKTSASFATTATGGYPIPHEEIKKPQACHCCKRSGNITRVPKGWPSATDVVVAMCRTTTTKGRKKTILSQYQHEDTRSPCPNPKDPPWHKHRLQDPTPIAKRMIAQWEICRKLFHPASATTRAEVIYNQNSD